MHVSCGDAQLSAMWRHAKSARKLSNQSASVLLLSIERPTCGWEDKMAMKGLIVATVVAGQGLAASWNLKGISAPHVEVGNLHRFGGTCLRSILSH